MTLQDTCYIRPSIPSIHLGIHGIQPGDLFAVDVKSVTVRVGDQAVAEQQLACVQGWGAGTLPEEWCAKVTSRSWCSMCMITRSKWTPRTFSHGLPHDGDHKVLLGGE